MRRLTTRMLAILVTISCSAGVAFAAEPANPGVRIGQWVSTKRQFTQFLSFSVFAVMAALFIFGGNEFKDAAVGLAQWVVGK